MLCYWMLNDILMTSWKAKREMIWHAPTDCSELRKSHPALDSLAICLAGSRRNIGIYDLGSDRFFSG
jgi:hypothetical protein